MGIALVIRVPLSRHGGIRSWIQVLDYLVTTISVLRALSPDLLQAVTDKMCVPGVSLRRLKLGCLTVAIRFHVGG